MNTQANFTDFHNVEIPEYHDACLASEFFSEWYEENGHNTLPYDKCVGYKVPLFLNGNDELNNLEVSDMEVFEQQRNQSGICQQAIVIDDRNFVMRADEVLEE